MSTGASVDAALARESARLVDRFHGVFSPQTVERCVFEAYLHLERTARVRTHLLALAGHAAAQRLEAMAEASGMPPAVRVPQVLFMCAYNAGRSQLAAALAERHGAGRIGVASAGSHPAGVLDPQVVAVLAETGIPADGAFPKSLTDDALRAADVIVTMGCGDACPVLPGKRYLDWDLPDPAGADLATVRAIRDDIDVRVRQLIDELTAGEQR